MSKNLPVYSKLLVISDTGMFRNNEGTCYAFGPVVKELEALDCFEKIVWIGFNRPDQLQNKSYIKLSDRRIIPKMLKRSGGNSMRDKISILLAYPKYTAVLYKEIYNSEFIHVRAPSNPAAIAIILSHFFPKKKFWFKYAGDWVGAAPSFYNFQRKGLKNLATNSIVTVNGDWPGQPKNVIAFENPCLDENDREEGLKIVQGKTLEAAIDYCFVGALNDNKGCELLLQTFAQMEIPDNFGILHIVGDGNLRQQLSEFSKDLKIPVIFHGALAKADVIKIYRKCHFIVLPSKSEGFPKVIGEAMNYGCVPIVSDISCLGQYIEDDKNGILIEDVSGLYVEKAIKKSSKISSANFISMIKYNYKLAEIFTYEYYKKRIINEILN